MGRPARAFPRTHREAKHLKESLSTWGVVHLLLEDRRCYAEVWGDKSASGSPLSAVRGAFGLGETSLPSLILRSL